MDILQSPHDWYSFSPTPTEDSKALRCNQSWTSKGHFSFRNSKLNKGENFKNQKTVISGLPSGRTIEEKN